MTLDRRPSDAELLRRLDAPTVIRPLVRAHPPALSAATVQKQKAIETALRKREADAIRAQFRLLCKASGLPLPITEYWFAWDAIHRRWPFDYAWPPEQLALEVDGGLFVEGGHVRGAYILKTHEKLNAAAALGWRVLYRVPDNLCTADTLDLVRLALQVR